MKKSGFSNTLKSAFFHCKSSVTLLCKFAKLLERYFLLLNIACPKQYISQNEARNVGLSTSSQITYSMDKENR